jgi:hypothetical protein
MPKHHDLAGLLQSNLSTVPKPSDYESFRQQLIKMRPDREPPMVKESPENRQVFRPSQVSKGRKNP